MNQGRSTPLQGSISAHGTFTSLRHRNYRLWFIGQLVSLIGTWMQNTAQGYLVYQLTQSPAYLGYVGFAAGLPSWLFTLYGGVIADRLSRRTMLVITQAVMLVLAFTMAGLILSGRIQPWHIIIMAFLLGTANAFDAPARQAFVVELLDDRADLTNAIALNAGMFNLAAVIGPAVGGMVYALVGPGWCFILNGISFVAVIIALLLMRIAPLPISRKHDSPLTELAVGFSFLRQNRVILAIIITVGMISVFGLGLVTLLPAWAVNVLRGDVTTNGLMLSARGLGALVGALMIAALGYRKIRGKMVMIGSFTMPVLFIVLSTIRWLPLSLLVLAGIGWSFMSAVNSANALVQSHIPDHLRGRIMSIYMLVFQGGMPIGALLAGTLAANIGEPETAVISSSILMAYSLFLFFRVPKIRSLG